MNMEIDMDKGMAMDTEIQRFRCRISDIGEKFNPVSHICNVGIHRLLSHIGGSDLRFSAISFITDIEMSAHALLGF
jgi:hypothetical protein